MAKGKAEPVAAYRLLGVDDARQRSPATHRRRVGRPGARDPGARRRPGPRLSRPARATSSPCSGAPGIGKTRLVAEFVNGSATVPACRGRCVSYGQGITYWPVVQLLREACGLQGDESTEVTRHALDPAARRAARDRRTRVVDLLLALLGKGGEPGGSDQTFWAVSRVLEQLALRRPLVVTVDDLHWAEPTLLAAARTGCATRCATCRCCWSARRAPSCWTSGPGWGGAR